MSKPKVTKPKPYARMTKREKSDLKRTIKTQNAKLERLEKSGLASSSAAYRYLEGQLAAGANWLRKDKNGNIRFKANISKLSAQTIAEIQFETRQFRRAKTSTLKGTRSARSAMVGAMNARLEKLGIDKKVRSADEVKNLYESALYRNLQKMFYSESVKMYTQAVDQKDEKFLQSLISASKDIDPEDIYNILDTHKEYEKATRGLLSAEQVQQLFIDYPIANTFTDAAGFAQFVQNVANHTEDENELYLEITNNLEGRFF